MISMIVPLPIGNALKVFLVPPSGALTWRILKNGTGTFAGESDPASVLAYEGTESYVLDAFCLQNDVPMYYCAFYWDGTAWTASNVVSGTPSATYTDYSTDALSLLRDRIAAGLAVEVERGNLVPSSGSIAVLTAPPQYETSRWPIVSVHLTSQTPAERAIGETFMPDSFDETTDQWTEAEGWLADVQITVIGWTQNPDERIELRKALNRIVAGNFPVFDAAGIVQPAFSIQDVDSVSGEYPAAVYQSAGTFTCMAPVIVGDPFIAPVSDVQVTVVSPN
jgi:hypothetical protein